MIAIAGRRRTRGKPSNDVGLQVCWELESTITRDAMPARVV